MGNPDEIRCTECKVLVGTLTEVPIEDRPGFFRNVCEPNPMPTKCPTCHNILMRVPGGVI